MTEETTVKYVPTFEEVQKEKKEKQVNVRIVAFVLFAASLLVAMQNSAVAAPIAVAALFVYQNNISIFVK